MTPKTLRVDYRSAEDRTVRFVSVLDDGTEEVRLTGKRVLTDKGVHLLDCGKLHVVVKPREDGTVGSWFENESRDEGMLRWLAEVTGWRSGR